MSRLLPALMCAVLLSGCTAASVRDQIEAEGGDTLKALAVVTGRDATAALEAARLAGDERGVLCWTALIPVIERLRAYREAVEETEAQGSGYLLKYQRARNIRRFVQDPPEDLIIACAPMLEDSRDVLKSLARAIGVL